MHKIFSFSVLFSLYSICLFAVTTPKCLPGIDVLIEQKFAPLHNKRVGLLTNQTGINSHRVSTADVFIKQGKKNGFTLAALFAPEHGFYGVKHSEQIVDTQVGKEAIPIYSLYNKSKRPTPEMLKDLDVLVYDIQEIGSRSYTYITTLFYLMEEAAKQNIPVIVLDRPNPMNGLVVDGPMMEEKWRSMVGYINVPYCHGMTTGELAQFFNGEYKIGCSLTVIPMKKWKRNMTFSDTGLMWIPTSPLIPEAMTALYYPVTGIMGELSIVSIGIGSPLPFKLVGAPWIEAKAFAAALNGQKFPGVYFHPFHFKPFYGKFANEECQGVLIDIYDPLHYRPVATQYLILGILKGLYPGKFKEALELSKNRKEMFCKVNGNAEVYRMISEENSIVWKLREFQQKEREDFMKVRAKYLIADYAGK